MERIKGMLVDDEVNILRNLRNVVPWESLGVDIIGMAKNGAEALEVIQEHHPSLILCDIRMPIMDGIHFIEEIRGQDEDCEIIMLTGYKDFEYMRSSIRYGVRDYLLKPIDYEGLRDVVESAASDIRMKQLKKIMEKKKWGNIAHLAYEKNLYDALRGYLSLSPWVWQERDGDGEPTAYQLFVVDMDNYSGQARFWEDEDRTLWNFAVKNVLSEALLEYGLSYAVLQMREGEWCILIERRSNSPKHLRKWADKLRNDVNTSLKLAVSVGGFETFLPVERLAHAYKTVQRDLHLDPGKHQNQVVVTRDKPEEGKDIEYFLWDGIENVVSALKQGERGKTKEALDDLNQELKSVSAESLVHVEQILHYLALHLLREMKEMDVINAAEEETVWRKLKRSVGNEDLINVIDQLVQESMEAFFRKKKSETLMIAARDYIDRHLDGDLGVEELADFLEISSSYFSMLFKQHFDQTFVEYLTTKRMEKAKVLMMTTNLSIAKIAGRLGYSDRRYFTKVFHKFAGMLPSEYREKHQKV